MCVGRGTTDSYLSIHPSICKSRKDSRRQEMLEAYVRRVMLEGKRIDEVWHELQVTSYTKIEYGRLMCSGPCLQKLTRDAREIASPMCVEVGYLMWRHGRDSYTTIYSYVYLSICLSTNR